MTKKECAELSEKATEISEGVQRAIKEVTKDKPLVFFGDEPEQEDLDEAPFGYAVSRHGNFLDGNVQRVCGDDVTLFLRGDDWGDTVEQNLSDLPFEALIMILDKLEEILED
jgi:hypothetical protein